MSFILLFIGGGFFIAGLALLFLGTSLTVSSQSSGRFSGATLAGDSRRVKRNLCFAGSALSLFFFTFTQGATGPGWVFLAACVVILAVTGYQHGKWR